MNIIKTLSAVATSATLLVLSGCATTDPENVEKDFGNSVRHMVETQTFNPAAPMDTDAIDHGDGTRINNAIESYRKGVADRESINEDFNFGADSSGN